MKLSGDFILVLLAACSALVYANIDLSQINVNDLQSQLPSEFANLNFSLEDAKTLLRDKCIQVSGKEKGEEAFKGIEEATTTLNECATNLINVTALQEEIEAAKPLGDLDVVFNSYCKKRPQALACIEAFNEKLIPCLDEDERSNQEVFMRIIRSLLNFICHKGGDQIALFIAEKGPECLESKRDDIQQCLNETFTDYIPKNGFDNITKLPKFVMAEKQCSDMEKLEKCIVDKLEKCEEITPANIVESMFRFIKNETICRTAKASKQIADGKSANATNTLSSFILLFLGAVYMSELMDIIKRHI